MNIRKANNDDINDILSWRNDSLTRQMSLDTKIITKLEHNQWFNKGQKDKKIYLLIAEENNNKVSFIKFEINEKENSAEISINLNPNERKKKKSFEVIYKSILYFKKNNNYKINKLIANIKKENTASKKSFSKNGFELIFIDKVLEKYIYQL